MTDREALVVVRQNGTVAVRCGKTAQAGTAPTAPRVRYRVNLMRKYGTAPAGWIRPEELIAVAQQLQEHGNMTTEATNLPTVPASWPALPTGYRYGHHRNASASGIAHAWQHTPRPRAKDRHETLCGVKM